MGINRGRTPYVPNERGKYDYHVLYINGNSYTGVAREHRLYMGQSSPYMKIITENGNDWNHTLKEVRAIWINDFILYKHGKVVNYYEDDI